MEATTKLKSRNFRWNIFFDSLIQLKGTLLPYCIFLVVSGPLMVFLVIANDRSTNPWRIDNDGKLDINSSILFGIFSVALLFGIWIVLLLTRYLHRKIEADVFLSLPIKRAHIIYLRMTAGGIFLFIPLLLAFAAVEIVLYTNQDWIHVNFDIHMKLFGLFVFFLIIIYIMLFLSAFIANTAVDTIIFWLFLQFVLPALGYLTFHLIRSGVMGFPTSIEWIDKVLYLSPALSFSEYGIHLLDLDYSRHYTYYNEIYNERFSSAFYLRNSVLEQMNIMPIICWTVMVFVLLFLIRMLANKRKAENAGRKGFTGFFSTMFLGIFIYVGAGIMTLVQANRVKQIGFLRVSGYAFLGGAVLGFAVYGLLNKGYNNMLKKAWKPYFFSILVSVSIISIIYCAPLLDYTPPEANDVEYISVKGLTTSRYHYYPSTEGLNAALYGEYDPIVSIQSVADMEKIISGHQKMINYGYFMNQAFVSNSFDVEYHMKNGSTRKLGFNFDWSKDVTEILCEMRGEEYIRKSNALFRIQPEQIEDIVIVPASKNNEFTNSPISKDHDIDDLLNALRADILELDTKAYEDLSVLIEDGMYYDMEEEFCGYIIVNIKEKYNRYGDYYITPGDWIAIHSEYTRTISWLHENGYSEYIENTTTSPRYW